MILTWFLAYDPSVLVLDLNILFLRMYSRYLGPTNKIPNFWFLARDFVVVREISLFNDTPKTTSTAQVIGFSNFDGHYDFRYHLEMAPKKRR